MHWADLELATQPRMNLNSQLCLLSAGIAGMHIMLDLCNAGGKSSLRANAGQASALPTELYFQHS